MSAIPPAEKNGGDPGTPLESNHTQFAKNNFRDCCEQKSEQLQHRAHPLRWVQRVITGPRLGGHASLIACPTAPLVTVRFTLRSSCGDRAPGSQWSIISATQPSATERTTHRLDNHPHAFHYCWTTTPHSQPRRSFPITRARSQTGCRWLDGLVTPRNAA